MPFILPGKGGVGGGPPLGAVTRSLRFNYADAGKLVRTPSVSGERRAFTFSAWVKRCALGGITGGAQFIFSAWQDSQNYTALYYHSAAPPAQDTFSFIHWVGNATRMQRRTAALCRDLNAWHHVCFSASTIPATPTAEITVNGIVYAPSLVNINGAQNDLFFVNAAGISQNVGYHPLTAYFGGYLANVHMIDGQALPATSFGEFDSLTNEWIPKTYSGSVGTNGFYLKFTDNSSVAALGIDYSGFGNNLTPSGFSVTPGAGNDSLVDSPSEYGTDTGLGGEVRGNYATLSPLQAFTLGTRCVPGNGNLDVIGTGGYQVFSAFGMMSGKWYCEATLQSASDTSYPIFGVWQGYIPAAYYPGHAAGSGVGWGPTGLKYYEGSSAAWGSTFNTGDTIGIAVDADTGKVWMSKNGTWQASGNPVTGANPAATLIYGLYYIGGAAYIGTPAFNFGQRPFVNAAPAGFKAMCTQNLPTPLLKRGDDAFTVNTRTGTGANYAVTGKRFLPSLLWTKDRTAAVAHVSSDIVRGQTQTLNPNNPNINFVADYVQAWTAGGYNGGAYSGNNTSGNAYVDWMWAEGAVLDIVTYTGNGAARTIAHNLAKTPGVVMIKALTGALNSWYMYHIGWGYPYYFLMDEVAPVYAAGTVWNNANPDTVAFYLGPDAGVNANGTQYVAYLFASIPGFSRMWYYQGNGLADGPFVHCGFTPKWIHIKNVGISSEWFIVDGGRNPINPVAYPIPADSPGAEYTAAGYEFDFHSNGFKVKNTTGTVNGNGQLHAFMAFAEYPFKYARARI